MKRFLALSSSLALVFAVGCTEKSPENPTDSNLSSGTTLPLSSYVDPLLSSYVDPGLSSAIIPIYSSFVDPGISSWVTPLMSSSVNPMLSSYVNPYLSSGVIVPKSSAVLVSSSAAIKPVSSSVYVDPSTQACGAKMPPPVSGGQAGWATRYWDCCKGTCSWREHTTKIGTPNGIARNCSANNQEKACFTPVNDFTNGTSTVSSCDGGDAFMCYGQVPWTVCDKLSYGYVAVQASNSQCGKCFQIDFTGEGKYGTKPAHALLKGKSMIVMASNTGGDVGNNHFDLMIPGGGFGNFTGGCAKQWNVDPNNTDLVGINRGGFLGKCQEKLGYNATTEAYKSCVRTMCTNLFGGKPEMADLLKGCNWFVDWFQAADNPNFTAKEVSCPPELVQGYESTFH